MNWLIIMGVLFVLFVITREYWCWYWKINLALKKIDAFTEQVQRNNFWLERISVQLPQALPPRLPGHRPMVDAAALEVE